MHFSLSGNFVLVLFVLLLWYYWSTHLL